jgi:hypothetical protein
MEGDPKTTAGFDLRAACASLGEAIRLQYPLDMRIPRRLAELLRELDEAQRDAGSRALPPLEYNGGPFLKE